MPPILEDRRRLALYLLAWLLIGLLLSVGVRADAESTTAGTFLVPLCLVFAFIGLSTWYLCRAFPLTGTASVWRLIVVQMMAAAAASALWTGLGYVWAGALDGLIGEPTAQPYSAQQRPLLLAVGALLYWLAAAAHYLLIAFQTSRDAETRAFEQTLLAREAELRALRAQIDPHFIFNSLHSISALTTTDAPAARTMCILLADFLRDTLRFGSSSRISLADEWSLAERFLAIEQVRFGPKRHQDGSRWKFASLLQRHIPHERVTRRPDSCRARRRRSARARHSPRVARRARRYRGHRRMWKRLRGGQGGRRAEARSVDARHPDAEARRVRRARARRR